MIGDKLGEEMLKKKASLGEKKSDEHIITFFWLIFLISSIISAVLSNSYNKIDPSKYNETRIVFDHIEKTDQEDSKSLLVYKYDIDGETYFFKEEKTSGIPKVGTEYIRYYNKDNPTELIESNNNNVTNIIIVAYFLIIVVISIIGEKIGGQKLAFMLSFIMLMPVFTVFSGAMLFGGMYFLISILTGGPLENLILAIFLGIMGIVFTPITIFGEIVLLKESIEIIKNKKEEKRC
jgi:hypothetical protein